MKFYLGTHLPHWLADSEVPLFVSRNRLVGRKSFPRAQSPWALDSGGFTEIGKYGEWRLSPEDYVAEVRMYAREIGNLAWAAPQDWMCEPMMLEKTGLTVADHQARTVENLIALRSHAPDLPIIPVLQGWEWADYLQHAEAYERAGVTLRDEPLVGVGSVCRRQNTTDAEIVIRWLHGSLGLQLHGFGVKTTGLKKYGPALKSADSMAWSAGARFRNIKLDGCTHSDCRNCRRWALQWRESIL